MIEFNAVNKKIRFDLPQSLPFTSDDRQAASLNSIWNASEPQNISEVSDRRTEKASETDKADSKQKERLDNLLNNSGSIKLDGNKIKNACDILDKSKIPVMSSLSVVFKSEFKSIGEGITQLFGSLADLQKSSQLTDAKMDELSKELKVLKSRAKNLTSKIQKSLELDKKLNTFVNNGGDLNKINMDKLSEDIMASLKLAEEGEESSSAKNADDSDDVIAGDNEELDQSDDSKKIDENLESFSKLLDKNPKEIDKSNHEYLVQNNSQNTSENTSHNDFTNMQNLFALKKNKNPFLNS